MGIPAYKHVASWTPVGTVPYDVPLLELTSPWNGFEGHMKGALSLY